MGSSCLDRDDMMKHSTGRSTGTGWTGATFIDRFHAFCVFPKPYLEINLIAIQVRRIHTKIEGTFESQGDAESCRPSGKYAVRLLCVGLLDNST